MWGQNAYSPIISKWMGEYVSSPHMPPQHLAGDKNYADEATAQAHHFHTNVSPK
jgi:hypothetical protein